MGLDFFAAGLDFFENLKKSAFMSVDCNRSLRQRFKARLLWEKFEGIIMYLMALEGIE